jgi:DNA-binding MarR family transcriptional regulator
MFQEIYISRKLRKELIMKKIVIEHYVDTEVYLIEQTSVYISTRGNQFFNELNIGISLDQLAALDTISCNQGICQRDLSKILLKGSPYTSKTLNILEKKGLIQRKIETKGNRLVKKIYLTKEGKKATIDNTKRLRTTFSNVFDNISDEEFCLLRKILIKMQDSISKFTIMPA